MTQMPYLTAGLALSNDQLIAWALRLTGRQTLTLLNAQLAVHMHIHHSQYSKSVALGFAPGAPDDEYGIPVIITQTKPLVKSRSPAPLVKGYREVQARELLKEHVEGDVNFLCFVKNFKVC